MGYHDIFSAWYAQRATTGMAVVHKRSRYFEKISVGYHDVISAWYAQRATTGTAVAHKSSHHVGKLVAAPVGQI